MNAFNWTCPFCNRAQAVTREQHYVSKVTLPHSQSVYGDTIVEVDSIRCANNECMKIQLIVGLYKAITKQFEKHNSKKGDLIQFWHLLPESSAKPQPDYIPEQIVEDYTEACKIRDLSPKASATLARRCIQGIIRDFCEIRGENLYSEIEELDKRVKEGKAPKHVLEDTVNAFHSVRRIGNIGAHMEKDVNLIIDVKPEEAQKLIWLIEQLFREWYVYRHVRAQSLQQLRETDDKKQEEREKKQIERKTLLS